MRLRARWPCATIRVELTILSEAEMCNEEPVKAIVIGATSGIGRELAKQLSIAGYIVGVTGRRLDLLESLKRELPGECFIASMDLTDSYKAVTVLQDLLKQMGDVNIVVINAGTGSNEPTFPLAGELDTVAVNVVGFTALANVAYHYFSDKAEGHIVATSSIMALRGGPCPSYNASKAYISSYLEGIYCKSRLQGKNISVTDIRPGYVDTGMAKGKGIFWMAPVEKAACQILEAIQRKRRIVYVTKRWSIIAAILKIMPVQLYIKAIG